MSSAESGVKFIRGLERMTYVTAWIKGPGQKPLGAQRRSFKRVKSLLLQLTCAKIMFWVSLIRDALTSPTHCNNTLTLTSFGSWKKTAVKQ